MRFHITWMTPAQAEAHTRRTMNIPDDHGLGWTPYNILVLRDGHTSTFACFTEDELQRWLRSQHHVVDASTVHPASDPQYYVKAGWTKEEK